MPDIPSDEDWQRHHHRHCAGGNGSALYLVALSFFSLTQGRNITTNQPTLVADDGDNETP